MCKPSDAALEQALRCLRRMRFTLLLLSIQMLLMGMVYADGDEVISTIASVTQGLGLGSAVFG